MRRRHFNPDGIGEVGMDLAKAAGYGLAGGAILGLATVGVAKASSNVDVVEYGVPALGLVAGAGMLFFPKTRMAGSILAAVSVGALAMRKTAVAAARAIAPSSGLYRSSGAIPGIPNPAFAPSSGIPGIPGPAIMPSGAIPGIPTPAFQGR